MKEGRKNGGSGIDYGGAFGLAIVYRRACALVMAPIRRTSVAPIRRSVTTAQTLIRSVLFFGRRKHGPGAHPPIPGAHHQQAAQVGIAGLRDVAQACVAARARAVLTGHQAEPDGELTARAKVAAIADQRFSGDGRGGVLADTGLALQSLAGLSLPRAGKFGVMKSATPSLHRGASHRKTARLVRNGEVPFIRLAS